MKRQYALVLTILFLPLAFFMGCAANSNSSVEEYSYEQLEGPPTQVAYQAMKAVYSLEETAPLDENFFEGPKRYNHSFWKRNPYRLHCGRHLRIQGLFRRLFCN